MTILLYKGATKVRGDEILPLNQLRDRYPDLHERHFQKYAGRPHGVDIPVYPLNCTWGDVVFLSPVHPAPIFQALHESGRIGSPTLDYWTLDAGLLDPANTCILLKRYDPELRPQPPEDFVPYTPEAAAALAEPSERALHRLRNLDATEPLYPWADIPHILHRGPIPARWFKVSAQETRADG
ncbi:hypothetical protein [Kribbella sp. NPDC004536]|uniref:hypothetical protein n=1 Tax=Kribbella sp. NPDC004536 TaxID=3364106 RepID=UPI00368B48E1